MSSDDAAAHNRPGGAAQEANRKQHEAALASCDRAIALDPADAEAHKNRGNALQGLGQHDAAIESYDRAIFLRPDFADAYYNRATVLMSKRHYDAAVESFDRAIAINPNDAEAYNNRGIALQALSRRDAAIDSFDRACELRPEYADAYYNRGVALNDSGRHDAAAQCFRRVVALAPGHVTARNALGIALAGLEQYDMAIQSYDQAIALDPGDADAFNNRGNAYLALRRFDEALADYDRALTLRPDFAEALGSRATVLLALQRYDDALASYDRALALKPDYIDALSNRGNVLRHLGKSVEAIASYDRALALKPDFAEALSNRANGLCDLGRLTEALAGYEQALAIKPDYAEALCNRGYTLSALGRLDEALASYDLALACKPGYAEASGGRGNVLQELGRYAEALSSYDEALALNPDYAEAYANRGNILRDQGRLDDALASYGKALAIKPEFAEVRWSMTMAQLPDVYGAGVDPAERRAAFETALAQLDAWFQPERLKDGYKAVSTQKVFYLAYQELNNRELLSRFGALCSRLMSDWMRRQEFAASASSAADRAARVKLGIVSRFFYDHSVWHAILRGWLQHFDRSRFELHLFYLGTISDAETAFAERNAATFHQPGGGLKPWVDSILGQHLDVLIYPEIGMDPMAVKLASMRLAPVQISTWGHPETSGLPTIDYFLSAEDLEPEDGSANYSERLVKLPRLGCCYHLTPVAPLEPDFGALAINPELPLLICPGAPFKYAPEHDWVLVAIARELKRCQLIFFTNPLTILSATLHHRLQAKFAQAGLKYEDFVVSVPWQEKAAFYGLMRRADVYLDTIGFSGFNTAMQAVECALPIATREGRYLRGRLASGILKRMGLGELVAPNEEAYIELVIRLVNDPAYRERISARIQESRHLLLDDLTPVRALEDFLEKVGAGTRH